MNDRRILIIAIGLLVSAPAFAADAPTTQPTPDTDTATIGPRDAAGALQGGPPPAPESIDQFIADAKARPAGLLPYGPVSILDPLWKRFNAATEDIGLKVGLAYTAAYQAATGGPGDRRLAGADLDLFGDWRLLGEKDGDNNGYLYFAAENRHDLGTGLSPSALAGQIGSLWGTTNGFSEHDLTLKELYWQQHFGKDRLILRAGKLDPENYYNSNYWQSDSRYFMNAAFSTFPVRAFPGQGLGINATVRPADWWYVSAGAQDAQGKKTTPGFDTLFDDFNLFAAVELGLTPDIDGWGRGTYRLTPWYRDAGDENGKPHDSGIALSFDQHLGPHWVPFFRAGWGDGNINGIDYMASGGIGWEGKLLTSGDVIAIGAAWGRPSDHDLDDQYSAEIFYRLQLSPDNQITVGYQVILDPTYAPDDDVVGVFELRWRIAM